MKKKVLIILVIVILLIALIIGAFIVKKKIDEERIARQKENLIPLNTSNKNEIINIIEDTTIQGKVEGRSNNSIYIFAGQHLGELGYEMKEYTTAHIENKNQICIDYITLEEYDTSYIEEGDILICKGDLKITESDFILTNTFDTKENEILVLKKSDYFNMIEKALKNEMPTIDRIDQVQEDDCIYLKYYIKDKTNSNIKYIFPFVKTAYKTDNTEVIGEIKEGKRVKVEYHFNGAKDKYAGDELKLIIVVE